MEIDDYDISYSSICDRINGNPQQAKKSYCVVQYDYKAEEKLKIRRGTNKAKTDVRFFKKGIYNTFH